MILTCYISRLGYFYCKAPPRRIVRIGKSISDSHAVVLIGRTTTSVCICSVWSLSSCCPIPILEGDSATHLWTERERSGGRVNRPFSSVFSKFNPICLYFNIVLMFTTLYNNFYYCVRLLHVSTHCRILMHIITIWIITRLECTPCTHSMLTIVHALSPHHFIEYVLISVVLMMPFHLRDVSMQCPVRVWRRPPLC